MKNVGFILLVWLFLGSAVASAAFPTRQLNQLFSDYNKRFVDGSYVKNTQQIQMFTKQQESLAAQLKASQSLRKVLVINNDITSALVITLYALVDDKNSLVGIYYEKSAYLSDNDKSFLRFRLISHLKDGLGFISVNGSHALTVKGHGIPTDGSAKIQFIFLTDAQSKQTSTVHLHLRRNNNAWNFFATNNRPASLAKVHTWTTLSPVNGGVRRITLE